MKTCSWCGVEKEESEFYSMGVNQLRPDCKECLKSRMQEYRKNNHEKVKDSVRRSNAKRKEETNGLYEIWRSMVRRCHEEGHYANKWYKDKGIAVCEDWRRFESFFEWAKDKHKPGLYIDRINNDRGYFPDNCRFVSSKVSGRNKSNTVLPEETISRIKKLMLDGVPSAEIGRAFEVGIKYLSNIRRNRSWADIEPVLPFIPVKRGRQKRDIHGLTNPIRCDILTSHEPTRTQQGG